MTSISKKLNKQFPLKINRIVIIVQFTDLFQKIHKYNNIIIYIQFWQLSAGG